jgi:DNA-directed RNA polymerase subunit alpha
MERFFLFTRLDKEPEEEASPAAGLGISPDVYNTLVETLALSARTLNCLKRAGLNRVGEVISIPKTELLKIRNFGQKSLDELYDKLAERNMLPEDDNSAEADGDTEEAPAVVEGSEEKAIEA